MTDIVDKALRFATFFHEGQLRKYTHEPYIEHPIAVAKIVGSVPHTKEMLCAALMHDTLEDTLATYGEVLDEFGLEIADLVLELTDTSRPSDGDRAARKAIDRERLSKASNEAKTIKLADLIDNTRSIVARDPAFAKVYMAEKRELLKVLDGGDLSLRWQAQRLVDDYFGVDHD